MGSSPYDDKTHAYRTPFLSYMPEQLKYFNCPGIFLGNKSAYNKIQISMRP